MNEPLRLLVAGILLAAPLSAQTRIQVGPFNSIEAPHGAHVVLQRAATQRVNLVRGSLDYTRVTTDGGRLIIDRCFRKCPKDYRLELEILTPNVTGLFLANGGSIQSRGGFPRQSDLAIAVSNGGTIDARSIVTDRVIATVNQGGRILTVPQATLSATINQGGAITYWGDPQVRSAVEHGGVVIKGRAGELDLPLSEVGVFTPSAAHETLKRR
ncbi:MAG: GIN domain-containing protein [Gemmatimonadaceae bacterium]